MSLNGWTRTPDRPRLLQLRPPADDPYASLERARALAAAWGSRFVDLGAAGHVNTAAEFGPWPEGEALLREWVEGLTARIAVKGP